MNITKIALKNMPMEGFVRTESELIFYHYLVSPIDGVFLRKARITSWNGKEWSESKEYILKTHNLSIPIKDWIRIDINNTEDLRSA